MQKPLFDTKVQELKYKVLKSVAKKAFSQDLDTCYYDIPLEIVSGKEATMRCCIYKERAIVQERVKLATGGDRENPNVIEVIPIACDECPVSSYTVTESCRGCIAHRCAAACPKDAISFDNHKAQIDSDKCIKCGKCAAVCPYNAITERKRPCEVACKVKAISSTNQEQWAHINNDKCIACGACVYQCPFGAVSDKSFILSAIDILKQSNHNADYNTYAVVAPAIASQYSHMPLGQVVAGVKKLGFKNVVEAALGADMVAFKEATELKEKGFLTSSCCPAFVAYIEKSFPALMDNVSHNLSPMGEVARFIKAIDKTAKIVFIGPCTAKKMEFQKDSVKDYIDCVITFEEFQALIDAKEIDMTVLPEEPLDNASYFGRIFARSGGLSDAVVQAVKEQGLGSDGFEVKSIVCDGIALCKTALLKANKGVLPENFIEGMVCTGGCIGGAGCMTHGIKDKKQVDDYGKEAMEKTISDAIRVYGMKNKSDTIQ